MNPISCVYLGSGTYNVSAYGNSIRFYTEGNVEADPDVINHEDTAKWDALIDALAGCEPVKHGYRQCLTAHLSLDKRTLVVRCDPTPVSGNVYEKREIHEVTFICGWDVELL